MANDDKPLTKAAARDYIKRAREALRLLEASIVDGSGGQDAIDACDEAEGCVAEVHNALDESFGGPGIKGVEGV